MHTEEKVAIGVVAGIVVVGGLWWLSNKASASPQQSPPQTGPQLSYRGVTYSISQDNTGWWAGSAFFKRRIGPCTSALDAAFFATQLIDAQLDFKKVPPQPPPYPVIDMTISIAPALPLQLYGQSRRVRVHIPRPATFVEIPYWRLTDAPTTLAGAMYPPSIEGNDDVWTIDVDASVPAPLMFFAWNAPPSATDTVRTIEVSVT